MRKFALRVFIVIALLVFGAVGISAQDNTAGVHVVQRGENLFRIAQYYATDVNTLAQINGITNTWQIFAGQTLIIPTSATAAAIASAPEVAAVTIAQSSAATTTHTVGRGENLTYIAGLYGMTAEQVAALNSLANPNLLYAGQQLVVNAVASAAAPAPAQSAPALPSDVRHTVRPGEYLASIAAQYGVSWLNIAQANGIYDPNTVFAGMELIIPGATSAIYSGSAQTAAPPAVVTIGRSIIVDLSDQMTYAYENGVLVRSVLSSTGLPATPTVIGDFAIERKYSAQTMSGPDYYLPDVPYVMYFYSGYALHGTYWHSNFGQPMSHGCVNLPTWEAEWFYSFADYGTPIRVQY
ncbi:MAG: LysM peptidoglycan-binding domain-containing protein [Pleurocapsa minor GSE-CHR-MK-17-07R]|jgi:LysM repeat protein|nr:LysM peptidoglycan-binding domain-containing protein [Pleurocapsa minor GSE-CHR-MK 17-07R]